MPSKSPAQARLMQAVAHGWKPSRIKGPSRAVAQEFVAADKKYSGGFAENRYWTGGLAAMNEINSGVPQTLNFQAGGEVQDPITLDMGDFKDILAQGWYVNNGWRWDPNTSTVYPPEQTVTAGGGDPAASLAELTPLIRGDATETNMPVVIPSAGGTAEPVQQTFAPSQTPEERAAQTAAARQSPYREQLREHKARIVAALNPTNAARGGYMNYQAGGEVPKVEMRPDIEGTMIGHAEGPNPFNPETEGTSYRNWERKRHIAAPTPPPPPPVVEEEGGGVAAWIMDALGFGAVEAAKSKTERELEKYGEEMGEARGGYMRGYQAGGLARVAPPSGGIPPWVEPIEYEEPQGYQLGGPAGMASRLSQMRNRMPSRGAAPGRGASPRSGGLAAMAGQQRQALAQRGGAGRWSPQQQQAWRGRQQQALSQRAGMAGMQADYQAGQQALAQRGAPGAGNPALAAQNRAAEAQFAALRGGARPAVMPGGGQTVGGSRGLTGPWQGSPETNPMRPRGPLAPGGGPLQLPGRGGGGIPGGARVPPNLQGFLQKQRMMNRPPSNVGGGVNRVGQQDQQGALSRAMQRGTGRRPMSRRGGFPGRGGVR